MERVEDAWSEEEVFALLKSENRAMALRDLIRSLGVPSAARPAFRKHLRSEEFRRVLMAMDMCCEEPKVLVGNLSGGSGMDYLRELRGQRQ